MIFLYIILALITLIAVLWLMGNYTFWLPYCSAKLPRILMFHQVNPHIPASGMNTPPEKFEQFLQILQTKNSQFKFVSELSQHDNQPNQVAITFDDGFLDNYQYAFPLLKKYHAKATIYLATRIADIETLSVDEVREMQDSGLIEFGAHTQNHVNLLKLDDATAYQEILQSKQDVEQLTGQCLSFAYPFGRFNEKHQQMVKEIGFVNAVSTRKKIEPYHAENQFNIPRISTHGKMNALQMRIALAKGRYKL